MTQTDEILLSLVRCANSGKRNESLSIKDEDWTSIIELPNQQAIPILVIDGLQSFISSYSEEQFFASETPNEKIQRLQWLGLVIS